jgi:tetratricopeptide (TPR) repeat protein
MFICIIEHLDHLPGAILAIGLIIAVIKLIDEKRNKKNILLYKFLVILTIISGVFSIVIAENTIIQNRNLIKKSHYLNKRLTTLILLCNNATTTEKVMKKTCKHLFEGRSSDARALIEAIVLYANTMDDANRQQEINDKLNYYIYNEDNIKEKIALLEVTINEYPLEFAEFHRLLAKFYWKEGKTKKAKSLLENAVNIEDDSSVTYHLLGRIYLLEGNWEKALSYYKIGLEKNSNYINLYIEIGDTLLYYKKKETVPEEVYDYYQTAINLAPNFESDDYNGCYKYKIDIIKKIKNIKYDVYKSDESDLFLKNSPFIICEKEKQKK